jgi:hypothetical protein
MGGWTRLWFAVSTVWVLLFGGAPLTDTASPPAEWWLVVFVPPLVLYITGLTVRWILRGFFGELADRRSA